MRKINQIRLLMIVSHLLLTGFMLFWLSERYAQEKEVLRKELTADFKLAEQSMIDSLLNTIFLHPIEDLKTAGITSIMLRSNVSSSGKKDQKDDKVEKSNSFMSIVVKQDSAFTFDSLKSSQNVLKEVKRVSPSERIRKDEVKLFARQISDTVSRKLQTRFAFASNTDTSILINNFNERIAELGFSVDWIFGKREVKGFEEVKEVKEEKEVKEGKEGEVVNGEVVGDFIFYSSVLDNSLAAQVSHYTMYLVKRLSTNIAVAIILLLIVGAAFAISLISFKKQLLLSRIRNDFVGNITHELKTPVATVKVAIEALLSYNALDDRMRAEEYLTIAAHETNRLEALIQRVIGLSLKESEADIIKMEKLCLREKIKEVIASMQIRIAQQQASVDVEFLGDNFFVKADSLHLQGVLNSLLDNSMNYSEQTPSIFIRLEEQPTSVLLTVSDNGIGIPEEYLNRVFDKFFRVPSGNRHNVKGYGLGLSYAASVMQQLNGSISVRNNPTGGCTFALKFPKFSA